jgi:hypothetical protein
MTTFFHAHDLDKAKLLDLMAAEYAFALRTAALLSPEHMLLPNADGYWTPKDIFQHLARWMDRVPVWVRHLRAGTYVDEIEPGWPWEKMDELNDLQIQGDAALPLDEVLAHFRMSHDAITALVTGMSDEEPFFNSIIGNHFGHFGDHLTPLRKWMAVSLQINDASGAALDDLVDKPKILDLLDAEYAFAQRTLRMLSPEQMITPGADGGWSPKDIFQHLARWLRRLSAWHEQLVTGQYRREIDPGWGWDRLDELNDRLLREDSAMTAEAVLRNFHDAHAQTRALIAGLNDADIFDNLYDGQLRRPFVGLIVADTYEHYREHIGPLRRWLDAGALEGH